MTDHLNTETNPAKIPSEAQEIARLQNSPDDVYVFPASFAQQRLWFIDKLKPGSPVYNICRVFKLQGALRIEALEEGINQIIKRHESLRTSFATVKGETVQMIAPEFRLKIVIIPLQHLSGRERDEQTGHLISEEAQRSFDLSKNPLMRVTLLARGAKDHVLILTFHHIIYDGWSEGIFMKELAEFYKGYAEGTNPDLPPLQLQYADFAIWQREWLKGDVLVDHLSYWKQQLAGAPSMLELPLDRPRPAVQSFMGAKERFSIPLEIYQRLMKLGGELGATLFMVLLATFKTFLYRYTGQEDIVVGVPYAGRNRSETEGLIGFFVNTLVLRSDLSGNPTFRNLVERVKEVTLEAHAHSDVPFEKLVQELHPNRSLSFTPLIQVMFVLQNNASSELMLDQIAVARLNGDTGTSKFDLTLQIEEEQDQLQCLFEYNTELFEEHTIQRMVEHYQLMIRAIASQPSEPVANIPILTSAEKRLLLEEWNTPITAPVSNSIHGLFEQQVEKTPENIAVTFEGHQLSYAELNQRANQLAHLLMRKGVGRNTLVGICMDRSLEMIISILGILKAGGAYIPIDLTYPPERVNFMLQDAGVSTLLTQKLLPTRFEANHLQILCLDPNLELLNGESVDNPITDVLPEDLCYVIYTSGSTGKPKGVMIPHQALVSHMFWMARVFPLRETDAVLQRTPFTFDVSVSEFFAPLLSGARLVIAAAGKSGDADYLIKLIEKRNVTVLQTVPSLLSVFLEHSDIVSRCSSLRLVFCAGEPLTPDLAESFLSNLKAELINAYGPTECCIYATYWKCPPDKDLQIVPIGKPIDNVQTYILDKNGMPVPIGIAGELYIGGNCLARGYINRPDLTEERFIPNPYSATRGEKFYKTGDRARYLADGNIEFLGRTDYQIKIRGFRVELGEVESVLSAYPQIKNCVVILREDFPGHKRLVAYFTSDGEILVTELRCFLKQKLPDYMIPSAFVTLERLPMTSSGKIDRLALPASDQSRGEMEEEIAGPQDALELQLVKIWERVLNLHPIGIHDNFFEIGGHSLIAVRLFSQIEKEFGTNLSLAALFHAPTVDSLAQVLRNEGLVSSWSSLVPIQISGSKLPFFAIHAGGGHVLFYRDLANRLGSDQPFYALQAQGLDGRLPRHKTVEEMAEHYIKEIRNLQPEGPYHFGGASFGGLVAYEMACQLEADGQKVGVVALFDTHAQGYPVYLPSTTIMHSRIHAMAERIQHHASNLLVAEWDQKFPYLLQKGRKAKSLFKRWIKRNIKAGLRLWSSLMGNELPKPLQQTQDTILDANESYDPKKYSGRVTIFRASKQPYGIIADPTLGWSKFSSNLKIYEVPGYHGGIISEPRVGFTAKILKDCLEEDITDAESEHQVVSVGNIL